MHHIVLANADVHHTAKQKVKKMGVALQCDRLVPPKLRTMPRRSIQNDNKVLHDAYVNRRIEENNGAKDQSIYRHADVVTDKQTDKRTRTDRGCNNDGQETLKWREKIRVKERTT